MSAKRKSTGVTTALTKSNYGNAAAIGAWKDLRAILSGQAGTTITAAASNIQWAS